MKKYLYVLALLLTTPCFAQQTSVDGYKWQQYNETFSRMVARDAAFDTLEAHFEEWAPIDEISIQPYFALVSEYIQRDTNLARA